MESLRIVITGTVGAGKSTFVRTFSDRRIIDTERRATDGTASLKPKTTVAFDFGMRALGRNMDLHVYGTPGQSRFDFMWDMLIRRADAYILLVAANRSSEFNHAREIVAFMNQRKQIPMVIGMTCTDLPGAWGQEHIIDALGYSHERDQPPIIKVNPRDRTSVFEILMVLMAYLLVHRNIGTPRPNAARSTHPRPSQNTYPWSKE